MKKEFSRSAIAVAWCVATLASATFAAATPAPSSREEMRKAFERHWTPKFYNREIRPAELVAREFAELSSARMDWTFALPVDDGSRLRFITATFEKGRFVSGTMHVMGLPDVSLTADDFKALRRTFPMLAVCDRKEAPACLFRPKIKNLKMPVPARQKLGIGLDPLREIYGEGFLSAVILRLCASPGAIRCRVTLTGSDGKTVPLGVVKCPRYPDRLNDKTIYAAIAAVRPDLVSEREQAEYYLGGSLDYEFVRPDGAKEAGK